MRDKRKPRLRHRARNCPVLAVKGRCFDCAISEEVRDYNRAHRTGNPDDYARKWRSF